MGIDDLIGADDNLVYTLYDGLLGRAPEAAGLQGWLPQVSGLDTLHDLVEKFLESPEGQARHNGLDDRGFVNKLYEDNLHREAEDAGLNAWTDALSHGASRADVATGILLSTEHLARLENVFEAGDVTRLYQTLLGRAPDTPGLHGWQDVLQHGASLNDVAQGFLASPEYQQRAGGLSNPAYVDDLYVHALGRNAEDSGLRFWQDQLEHGASRASVAASIADSVEAHQHLSAHVEQIWHL